MLFFEAVTIKNSSLRINIKKKYVSLQLKN